LNFLGRFFEKVLKYKNFLKIHQVGTEFFPFGKTDRQTEMTQVIFPFRDFANELGRGSVVSKTKTLKGNDFGETPNW
jgi:hypothetical protein